MTKSRKIVKQNKRNTPLKKEAAPKSKNLLFIKNTFKSFWGIVIIISVLSGIYYLFFPYPLSKLFQTEQEKRDNEIFDKGELKAPPAPIMDNQRYSISKITPDFNIPRSIKLHYRPVKGIVLPDLNKNGYVFVSLSGYIFTCFRVDLEKGIDIFDPFLSNCATTSLNLAVKDSKLYVSVVFKDLEKEEVIGIISYNHWQILKTNVLKIKDDDPEKFEVIDKQNNIVFSMKYQAEGVWISGYFIGAKSIIVMPNDPKKYKKFLPLCILKSDSSWKQKALDEIIKIKTIY
ncbi:hypothetical protein [Mucilaginibacter sp.]|uniref:hypothetical protein n=1 Tax=Mucilaginibacter sp. TaxID=1882438 RepID=UPI003D120CA1